jgi:hypothetical protein
MEQAVFQARKLDVENPSTRPANVLALQRAYGNRAVSGLIQAKLKVGPVGDRYEQEADRVAGQVMGMQVPAKGPGSETKGQSTLQREAEPQGVQTRPLAASITPFVQRAEEEQELQAKPLVQRAEEEQELQAKPLIQRAEEEQELQAKPLVQRAEEEEQLQAKSLVQRAEEEEQLQAKPLVQRAEEEEQLQAKSVQRQADGSFDAGPGLEDRLAANKGGGSALPGSVRDFMEPRFGTDFSGVRVHTGAESMQMNRELKSQAFTHGQDIYMGADRYNPSSESGKQLLAHELTHVIQQSGRTDRIARWGGRDNGTKHDVVTEEGFKELDTGIRKWYSPGAREYLAHHSDDMDMRGGFLFPVAWKIFRQKRFGWRKKGMYSGDMSVKKAWKLADKKSKKAKQGKASYRQMLQVYREEQRKRAEAYDAMEGYGRDPGESPNHAEGGMYKKLSPQINIQRYTQYIDNAVKAWKAGNRTQALHTLSLALHTAQDRGAHGDGVPGLGHDPRRLTPPPDGAKMGWVFHRSNPGWKPGDKPTWGGFDTDKAATNPNGFKMAIKETTKVLTAFALGIGLKPSGEVDEKAMDVGRELAGYKKPSRWRRFGRKTGHFFGGKDVIKP